MMKLILGLSIAQSSSNKGGVEIRGYTDTAGSDPGVRIRGIIASDFRPELHSFGLYGQ